MKTFSNKTAITLAILAAALYAISTPVSKVLLQSVSPTMLAAFLYIGAGMGMGAMMLVRNLRKHAKHEERLQRGDLLFVVAMVSLDILAPIMMMYGLKTCSAANASLLNNFEIVATALIALLFFGEAVTRRLWLAIGFVTTASILLSLNAEASFDTLDALSFSNGSLLVLGATVCWGLENNCTRQIANRDPMEIVTIKGCGSGLGALGIALVVGEPWPQLHYIAIIVLLGFVAYGLSIFCYTYAQRTIGASKTSTYYALAPFIGAIFSIILLGDAVTLLFMVASVIMAIGCWIAAKY
jgi:drug/metabolite transporter (DMT)-like permease